MTDGPALRDFEPGDQAAVRALILAGLAERWGVVDDSLNPDLDDIVAIHQQGRVVVVEVADAIVATGALRRRATDVAEVVRMSVAPTARRRGLGRLVLDELLRTACSWRMRAVVLETSSAWGDAIAFYEACGFQVTAHVDGPFGQDTCLEQPMPRQPGPADPRYRVRHSAAWS